MASKPQSNWSHFRVNEEFIIWQKISRFVFYVYCCFGGFASRLWSNIFLPPTVREREEGRGVTEFDGQIMEMLSITSSFHPTFIFLVKHLFLFLIYEDHMKTCWEVNEAERGAKPMLLLCRVRGKSSRDIVYPSGADVSDMDMCITGPDSSHDTGAQVVSTS